MKCLGLAERHKSRIRALLALQGLGWGDLARAMLLPHSLMLPAFSAADEPAWLLLTTCNLLNEFLAGKSTQQLHNRRPTSHVLHAMPTLQCHLN